MSDDKASEFKYTYSTVFDIPFSLQTENEFNEEYCISDDGDVGYEIIYHKTSNKTEFRVFSKVTCTDPMNHRPNDYKEHAPELWELWYIVRLGLIFATNSFPFIKKKNTPLKQLLEMPSVNNNFDESAKAAGIKLPNWVSVTCSFPVSWSGTVKKSSIDNWLPQIVKKVYNAPDDTKMYLLENYAYGLICPENPYFFWYRALETICNSDYGMIEKNAETYNLNGKTIPIKEMKRIANSFRHGRNRNINKTSMPKMTEASFKDSLKSLIQEFILNN